MTPAANDTVHHERRAIDTAARPRLVATDLDGTIVRRDGTISDRVAAVLAAVAESDTELVLVTGRPPRWMPDIADRIGHRGLALCANGALVYDLATERVLDSYLLEAATVANAVEVLRAGIPGSLFAVEGVGEETLDFWHEADFPLAWEQDQPRVTAVELEALTASPAAKLLLRNNAYDPDDLLAQAREIAGDVVELTHSSHDGLLEISATGVTKATGLAILCETRGIDAADVLAFGDMPNDLPLLAWAGRAYAVANAHPDVLAAVDDHIPGVEDDGVATVLERWFGAHRVRTLAP